MNYACAPYCIFCNIILWIANVCEIYVWGFSHGTCHSRLASRLTGARRLPAQASTMYFSTQYSSEACSSKWPFLACVAKGQQLWPPILLPCSKRSKVSKVCMPSSGSLPYDLVWWSDAGIQNKLPCFKNFPSCFLDPAHIIYRLRARFTRSLYFIFVF